MTKVPYNTISLILNIERYKAMINPVKIAIGNGADDLQIA